MDTDLWYSARCIFRHTGFQSVGGVACYEERISLFRAESFEEAIRKAGKEAWAYASESCQVEYLGYLDVYHLFEEVINDGTEVFSLMRTSELDRTSTFLGSLIRARNGPGVKEERRVRRPNQNQDGLESA